MVHIFDDPGDVFDDPGDGITSSVPHDVIVT
jgi:hypothetical protein